MKYLLCVVIFVACSVFSLFCREIKVKAIRYRIIDEKVEIFYDLPIINDTIDVKIFFLKKSSPDFKYQPRFLSGDVGTGIFSGKSRKIVWEYNKEPPYIFTGSGFSFDIKVMKLPVKQATEKPRI